jgi:hypothetical protein
MAWPHLKNRLYKIDQKLKITNQTKEEMSDDREDDGRIIFEI